MNDGNKSQVVKESKFRFLNPDEKRKLKVIKDEILGDGKKTTFDSNTDSIIQFEKRSYDTQRYNIKKLVDERLSDTIVFDSKIIEEQLQPKAGKKPKYEQNELKHKEDLKFKNLETKASSNSVNDFKDMKEKQDKTLGIVVTDIVKNTEDAEEEEIREKTEEQIAIFQKELARILSNNTKIGTTVNEEQKLETSNNEDLSQAEKMKLSSELLHDNKYSNQKRDINEEKRKQTKELFSESEPKIVLRKRRINPEINKFLFFMTTIIIVILILYIIGTLIYNKIENNKNPTIVNDVNNTNSIELVDRVSPVSALTNSEYEAIISIDRANVVIPVLEITNKSFQYNSLSSDTDFFEKYVFANIKNGIPYNSRDKLIVVFGKNDSNHFGSLTYLSDMDHFNSIEVNYTTNSSSEPYRALAFYETSFLDPRIYENLSDDELHEFLREEIDKSDYIKDEKILLDKDTEILTLVTYDIENFTYYVAYFVKK